MKSSVFYLSLGAILIAGGIVYIANFREQASVRPVAAKDGIDSMATMHRVNVDDYLTTGDRHQDAGVAIRRAIADAIKLGPGTVVSFGDGAYYLKGLEHAGHWGPKVAVFVDQAVGLILEGTDSTCLVITDPESAAVVFNRCRDVSMENIRIDYDPVPYAQGTIEKVNLDEQTFDLRLDDTTGFLSFDHIAFDHAKSVLGYTVRKGGRDGAPVYGPIVIGAMPAKEIEPGLWRLQVNPQLAFGSGSKYAGYPDALRRSGLSAGDRYIHWARAYVAAVAVMDSQNVKCEKVVVYASPGLAFFPYLSSQVKLIGCALMPRPGSTRLISTNADGVHARGMRGPLIVSGCRFEAMGDDAINIHSSAIRILNVSGGKYFFKPHTYSIREGDRLQRFDSLTGEPGKTYTVAHVKNEGGCWVVEFEGEVSNPIRPGPNGEYTDFFYNLSEAGEGFVIENNYFGPHRGRGILISANDGEIRGNTFRNREVGSGWAIVLHHENRVWAEGPVSRQIRIVDNIFEGPGGAQAAIRIDPLRASDGSLVTDAGFSDIFVEDNQFRNLEGPAIEAHQVDGLSLIGNRIGAEMAKDSSQLAVAIKLSDCKRVVAHGNELTNTRFAKLMSPQK